MNYEILTETQALDTVNDEQKAWDLWHEQTMWLLKNGYYPLDDILYKVEFNNGKREIMPLFHAIQLLALKDGADLVRFDNGDIGFLSIYGNEIEWFKIIGYRTEVI